MPVIAVSSAAGAEGTVVLTAAEADEVAGSLPGADRPAFSYLALAALSGWGDDGDGAVTAEEVVNYAKRSLLTVPGRTQTPTLTGASNFVLAQGVVRETADANRASDSSFAALSGSDVDAGTATEVDWSAYEADGIPDSFLFVSAHIGIGVAGPNTSPSPTLLAMIGVKFNAFSKRPREWRLGVRGMNFQSHNNEAPSQGTFVSDPANENDLVYLGEDPEAVRFSKNDNFAFGPQFGHAWRWESAVAPDTVLELDGFGAIANQRRCMSWTLEHAGFDDAGTAYYHAKCSRTEAALEFGGGLGIQAQWAIFEAGLQAGYLSNVGLFGSMSAGFSFDI